MTTEEQKADTKGRVANVVHGVLKGVPYIGPPLEHFIFGSLQEIRMKRIEETLSEIAESLGDSGAESVTNERFVTLLESVAPDLSRSIDEEKRQRFRDLLTNAATLPSETKEWEEAALASTLLREIEAPGLAILAALAQCKKSADITLTSRPVSQVVEGPFDYEEPGEPQHALPYEWVLVEYWARELREKGLIGFGTRDARGGFGRVALTPLGEFLIRWSVRG